MPNKWDQYAAQNDPWDQYTTKSAPSVPAIISNASQPAGAPSSVQMDDRDNYQVIGDATEQGVTDLGVGAAKSAFGTLVNAGRFSDWMMKKFGVSPESFAKSDTNIQRMSTPSNTTQKIGAGAEQVGEMALSGSPLRSGATGMARYFPALTKYLAPAARIVAEGVNAGTNAVLHDQDPKSAAAIGAGGAAVSEAAPLLAPGIKRWASNQYSKVLAPTTQRTKAMTEKVVPELLDRGVRVPHWSDKAGAEALSEKAAQKMEHVGSQIGQAVSQVPSNVAPEIQPILDTLDRYKQSFLVNGVPINEGAVQNADKLRDTITQVANSSPGMPNISYQSLNRARQILDEGVARAGGYYGKTLAEGSMIDAQREAANAMRRELSKASPDIKNLNAEFHFWSQVKDITDATAQRKTGQQGLINTLWGIAGTGLGLGELAGHGGSITHGAEGALALGALAKAVRSPAWRTTSAVFKSQLAQQLANGNAAKVMTLLERAGVASIPKRDAYEDHPVSQAVQDSWFTGQKH